MKNVWLLATVLAVVGVLSFFATTSEAVFPACKKVYGLAYKGVNTLPNYPIQASADSGQSWSDVASSNGSGRYSWTPSGYPDGTNFLMRIKPLCINDDSKADPTDTPGWTFNSQSVCDSTQRDVHGAACQ